MFFFFHLVQTWVNPLDWGKYLPPGANKLCQICWLFIFSFPSLFFSLFFEDTHTICENLPTSWREEPGTNIKQCSQIEQNNAPLQNVWLWWPKIRRIGGKCKCRRAGKSVCSLLYLKVAPNTESQQSQQVWPCCCRCLMSVLFTVCFKNLIAGLKIYISFTRMKDLFAFRFVKPGPQPAPRGERRWWAVKFMWKRAIKWTGQLLANKKSGNTDQ